MSVVALAEAIKPEGSTVGMTSDPPTRTTAIRMLYMRERQKGLHENE
jgi:hypothetical protein